MTDAEVMLCVLAALYAILHVATLLELSQLRKFFRQRPKS